MDLEEMQILTKKSLQEIEMPIDTEKASLIDAKSEPSSEYVCAFSSQDLTALDSEERSKSIIKLARLILFYLLVMLVEIFGGLRANSLAVISDAGHLLSDVAGFSISLFAVWAAGWQATPRHSFGYHRIEILGALLSVQLIWLISGILIYEAVGRIFSRSERVNGALMFGVAAFGFVVNFLMVIWLGHHHIHGCSHSHHDHDHDDHDHGQEVKVCASPAQSVKTLNINVQGAYLHVMVDMIQSVGVMISGAIIWAKPEWLVVDLICTLVFSVVSLSTTISMLKSIYAILMEQTPREIDIAGLETDLKRIKGVWDVRDLHVWALTVGKTVLSCHVAAEPEAEARQLVRRIREYCKKEHRIYHVTVQIE